MTRRGKAPQEQQGAWDILPDDRWRRLEMTTEIYYFSGTGNSLHTARELQRRLGDVTLLPIVGAMKARDLVSTAERVGLVFPIQALTLPATVERFLVQIDLASADYVFFIATRICSASVFSNGARILGRQGASLDASFSVDMAINYTPLFQVPSSEELVAMEERLQEDLDRIASFVRDKAPMQQRDGALLFVLAHTLYPLITAWYRRVRFPVLARSFYADATCTGCGMCEKVCLADRIRLTDSGPEWQESADCTLCFACLHHCPAGAIQIARTSSPSRGRYRHPDVAAGEVARQKTWPRGGDVRRPGPST